MSLLFANISYIFNCGASLKDRCPEGIYLSIAPGDPGRWSGAFFVRRGPYAPAILRLQISLPDQFPDLPPLITFSTDIFHPLVVPLTTYTFSSGAIDVDDSVSGTDVERLPSGAFSLGNGFPHWFRRSRRAWSGQNDSNYIKDISELSLQNEPARVSMEEDAASSADTTSILKVLAYVKSAFEDNSVLDDLPLVAAANPGAWHAWQSHRGLPKATSRTASPAYREVADVQTGQKQPGDWNWEGVWEKRVSGGIEASTSDSTLFGGLRSGAQGNDLIRFRKIDEEQFEDIKNEMELSLADRRREASTSQLP